MKQLPLFPGILPHELIISDQVMHLKDSVSALARSGRPSTVVMALGVDEALDMLSPSNATTSRTLVVDRIKIGYTPKRMNIIKHNRRCVCCGRGADVALVERAKSQNEHGVHSLALYIVSGDSYIPLTVDHMLLVCMGGAYNEHNLRTMCLECNARRADMMSFADIAQVRANPRVYLKGGIDVPWLMHTLTITEEYVTLLQTGTRKQIAMKRDELIHARSFLQRGKVPPKVPTIPLPNPWTTWWNSMPSIWPAVYGWVAERHSWFTMPQLFVR